MDRNLLMIDISMMVEEASKVITDNSRMDIEDDFIITSGGKYKGIGKVVDLLKKITDLQIRNARHANPLTMLPGNVPIYEMIDQLLEEKKPFSIAYCDLDNFKPFNDCYGYKQGDEVIKKTAELFLENIDPRLDFVGHVGGDDFIIIFRSPDWERHCNKVLKQFPQQTKALASNRLFVEQRQGPSSGGVKYFLTVAGDINANTAIQPSAIGPPYHKHA